MNSRFPSSVGRGIFYICVAAIAWGTGGAAAALLYDSSGMGPVAVSFWRFASGVLFLAAGHLALRRRTAAHVRGNWWQVAITGVGLAVYQTAYFAGVGYAGLAIATVVTLGSGPILIALGSWVLMGERLGKAGAVTVVMALLGLVLLVGGGHVSTASAPGLGLACALLSGAGYAGVTLLNRKIGRDGDNRQSMALGGFAVGMVCLLPFALLEGLLPTSGEVGPVLGLIAYLGFAPTALAYSLFFAGLATIRATTAAVVALIEPVTAAIIAVLLLDEPFTKTAAVGSVVLLGSVVALTVGERRASATQTVALTEQPPTAARSG